MENLELLRAAIVEDEEFFPRSTDDRIVAQPRETSPDEDFMNERINEESPHAYFSPQLLTKHGWDFSDQKPRSKINKEGKRETLCDLCGVLVVGNNMSAHRRTKIHQVYEKMNSRLKHLVLNTNVKV